MKKRIQAICILVIFLCHLAVIPPVVLADSAMQEVIFENFGSYTGIYQSEVLPESIAIQQSNRDDRIGAAYVDDLHGVSLQAGYRAEPIVKFDTLIDSGKLHVSFETMTNAVDERKMLVGFYDSANGNTEVTQYDTTGYNQTIFINGGKIYCFDDTMKTWSATETGMTYQEQEWHKFDFLFDFDARTGFYYMDGEAINTTPLDPTVVGGFKGLYFRVESTSATDTYLTEDGAFFLDNIYVHHYTDTEVIAMTSSKNILTPGVDHVWISLSEAATVTEEQVSVVHVESKAAIPVSFASESDTGFSLILQDLQEGETYQIVLKDIVGGLTGATTATSLTLTTRDIPNVYYYEGFEGMDVQLLTEEYAATNPDAVSLAENAKGGQSLQIVCTTARNTLKKTFLQAYTDSVLSYEFSFLNETGVTVDFGVLTSDTGSITYLGRIDGNEILYRDTTGEYRLAGCTFAAARQNQIRLIINQETNRFRIVTGTGSTEFDYTAEIGTVYGIFFRIGAAYSGSVLIDDVKFGNMADATDFSATFGLNPVDEGGISAYTTNTIHGLKLDGVEPVVRNGNTEYYVTRKDGTVYLDLEDDLLAKSKFQNISVKVTYTDDGYGWFLMRYKNQAGEVVDSELVSLTDTSAVLDYTFTLWDIALDTTGYDIEISTIKKSIGNDGYFTASGRRFSMQPVYLNGIEVVAENTCSPIEVQVSSSQEGNIFYDMETPIFIVTYTNLSEEELSVTASYFVLEEVKAQEDSAVQQDKKVYTLSGGETVTDRLLIPVSRYGLYRLELSLYGSTGGSTVRKEEEILFSMCVKNTGLNKSMGAGAHLANRGDPEIGVKLMANAGLGLLRDDFGWTDYEPQNGTYNLHENIIAELNAVKKYDVDFLAILSPYNNRYDSYGSEFADLAYLDKYQTYVEKMLSEELLLETVSMIEVINEPDQRKTYQGEYIHGNNDLRSDVYLEYLKATKDAVTKVEEANPDKDYKIGAMVICGPVDNTNSRDFVDRVLYKAETKYPDEKLFDTMSMHPYFHDNDPEIGELGAATEDPNDNISYQIEYFRSLLNGSEVYNYVDDTYEVIEGTYSGVNDLDIQEPFWLSEFGYSSANVNSSFSVGSEYLQAVKLIRGYNQIKLNRFDDKVWIYDLIDDGDASAEVEYNFGILHSHTSVVPYSAKYAYLAIANYNCLTAGATECSNVYDTDYSFATKYSAPNSEVYMMYTSKPEGSTVDLSEELEGKTVSCYDMIGNPLPESQVKNEFGEYIVSTEPYYAVVGEAGTQQPQLAIHLVDGIFCLDTAELQELPNSAQIQMIGLDENTPIEGKLFLAGYQEDTLAVVSMLDLSCDTKHYDIENLEELKACDRVKFLVMDINDNLKPLCHAYNKEKKGDS